MRVELDCSDWADSTAVWEAVLNALQAPAWHGRNLDALWDGLTGGLLTSARPLELVVRGQANPQTHALLLRMQALFAEAQKERGEDVLMTLP